jgi:hypothetical protein
MSAAGFDFARCLEGEAELLTMQLFQAACAGTLRHKAAPAKTATINPRIEVPPLNFATRVCSTR